MRTDPVKANRMLKDDTAAGSERRGDLGKLGWWRRGRTWLPFVVKPLRRGILIFVVLLIVEYLVVPELVSASKDLSPARPG